MVTWKKGCSVVAAGLSAAAVLLTGCSSAGVNSATNGVMITSAAKTNTATLITDAPSDQVLALGLTVTGIRMFNAKGNYADVLTTPAQIEALHLDAQQEPLCASLDIPQDTYVSATIAVANPQVTYVDPSTKTVVHAAGTLAASTTTVTFNMPITVTATSAPILFDLLVGQSVAISGTTVTVTPMFNVTQIPLALQPTNPGNGKVSGIVGAVVSVSGTNLTLAQPNGQQVVIATNSATTLQGFSSLSGLTAGQMVDVDVAHQTNGTLLALRIHLIPAPTAASSAVFLAGPVTATTGKPVTSFTQTVRQALGSSTSGLTPGASVTVTVNSGTQFALAPQAGNVPTLPFTPVFSAANLIAGQNVGVTASALTGTAATASTVSLLPQTVEGTVASVSSTSGVTAYTVTLPSGGALATLTGASTVVVYEVGAQVQGSTTLAVGASLRINGLLFNDSGTLRLVALLRCDPPPAPPVQHH